MMGTKSKSNRIASKVLRERLLGPNAARKAKVYWKMRRCPSYLRTMVLIRKSRALIELADELIDDYPPGSGSLLEEYLGADFFAYLHQDLRALRYNVQHAQGMISSGIPPE